jgi:tetratricopeptide (TPR) repeat protein
MKNTFVIPAASRRHFYQDKKKSFGIYIILTGLLLLTSCSSKDQTAASLERQIKFQQVQQELTSEPAAIEKRTAAELAEQGDRYLSSGDINRAYIYYSKGLEIEPDNISLIHKQGALLLKKKKLVEAAAVYEKLLLINNKDSVALEGRGKVYYSQNKLTEAEQDFLAALAINPDHWQSHQFLGLIYSRRQEFDNAINRFNTALAHQPDNASLNNNLAVTYYLNGNFQEAVKLLQRLVKSSKNHKVYNNFALASFQLGLYDQAMDAFKRGSDNEAAAYNNMGYEFLTKKKYKKAIQAFEKAIALHPKFYPSAQNNLVIANNEYLAGHTKPEN